MSQSAELGSLPISRLIWKQSLPASIGFLVMSLNGIVDTIFVGRFIGTNAIGAITIILPITFLISAIGMSIGIGGGSIISRALGADNDKLAEKTYGNIVSLAIVLSLAITGLCWFVRDPIVRLFGGQGEVFPLAIDYFTIIIPAIPLLAWAMAANNIIRAEGRPKIAMFSLLIPAVANVILDPIFIVYLDMGIKGAALATAISYASSGIWTIWFFISGQSELNFKASNLIPDSSIVKEISALGSVSLARQGVVSILAIILNNSLYAFGAELAVSVYGIISRMMMLLAFPVIGLTQGFLPIAGYNYGADLHARVKEVIDLTIKYGTIIVFFIFIFLMIFAKYIIQLFTVDQVLIDAAVWPLRIVFLATPLWLYPNIGPAFFQSIGRAKPALFLTLTKQVIFLIPLLLILPRFFDLNGVWAAFPIADLGAAIICWYYLRKAKSEILAD